MIQAQTRVRVSAPDRWQKAAERAFTEGVMVFHIDATGQWIATSGSTPNAAYELGVTGNVAHDCSCLAGLNEDPCCKHRAAFYILIGALEPVPEPEPPAPIVALPVPDAGERLAA